MVGPRSPPLNPASLSVTQKESHKSLGPHPRVGHLPSFRETARKPRNEAPGAASPGVPPTGPTRPGPGGGRAKGSPAHAAPAAEPLCLCASGPPASAQPPGPHTSRPEPSCLRSAVTRGGSEAAALWGQETQPPLTREASTPNPEPRFPPWV